MSRFICASEEKIIRMFESGYNTVKLLNELSKTNIRFSKEKTNEEIEKRVVEGNKQALGLMTKQGNIQEFDDETAHFDISNFDPSGMLTNQKCSFYSSKLNFQYPPDEDFLINHTLWPEVNKLYGHSYEVFIIASSNKGDVFASAGSAKTEKYAQLFIWSTKSNNVLQRLSGHVLTIIQIEFSHDDSKILTVSRGKFYFKLFFRQVLVYLPKTAR